MGPFVTFGTRISACRPLAGVARCVRRRRDAVLGDGESSSAGAPNRVARRSTDRDDRSSDLRRRSRCAAAGPCAREQWRSRGNSPGARRRHGGAARLAAPPPTSASPNRRIAARTRALYERLIRTAPSSRRAAMIPGYGDRTDTDSDRPTIGQLADRCTRATRWVRHEELTGIGFVREPGRGRGPGLNGGLHRPAPCSICTSILCGAGFTRSTTTSPCGRPVSTTNRLRSSVYRCPAPSESRIAHPASSAGGSRSCRARRAATRRHEHEHCPQRRDVRDVFGDRPPCSETRLDEVRLREPELQPTVAPDRPERLAVEPQTPRCMERLMDGLGGQHHLAAGLHDTVSSSSSR